MRSSGLFCRAGRSVDMDYFLAQVLGADVDVVVALPLLGDAAHADGLGGAVLQAAEAADAVFAEAPRRVILPRGQSSTHWPQEVQASLALNLAAFLPESLGIMEASKALMGLERGALSVRRT